MALTSNIFPFTSRIRIALDLLSWLVCEGVICEFHRFLLTLSCCDRFFTPQVENRMWILVQLPSVSIILRLEK